MELGLLTLVLAALVCHVRGLSPKGSHVCASECRRLHWVTEKVRKPCNGHHWYKKTCHVKVRRPMITKTTCYDCCTGWRQSDKHNCDTACPTGFAGIDSCTDLPDGWYQLCDSCVEFAHCDAGSLARHPCPAGLIWDDYSKRCKASSQTCNQVFSNKWLQPKDWLDNKSTSSEEDLKNELTNEIEPPKMSLDGPKDCRSITCKEPGRCIMMFGSSKFHMEPKCICPPGMRTDGTDPIRCVGINECQERAPCKHGRCINREQGYKCRCEKGWKGRHCNKPRKRYWARQRQKQQQVEEDKEPKRNKVIKKGRTI